jgi:hypothetical protein
MKLAWLCYERYDEYSEEEQRDYGVSAGVTIVFSEPSRWQYSKVVPIVYAEIED